MKKTLLLLLFLATATFVQAQVSKILGEWYTIDDKTGEQRSSVKITEKNGSYQAVVTAIYDKDSNGNYREMKPPYPEEWKHVVGTQIFIDMKVHGDHLKGKVFDPRKPKDLSRQSDLQGQDRRTRPARLVGQGRAAGPLTDLETEKMRFSHAELWEL